MGVQLLFQHAQIVAHHHDLVKENFQRHFLGLQCWIGGVHDQFAILPAHTQFLEDEIRLLQAERGHGRLHGFLDKKF